MLPRIGLTDCNGGVEFHSCTAKEAVVPRFNFVPCSILEKLRTRLNYLSVRANLRAESVPRASNRRLTNQ